MAHRLAGQTESLLVAAHSLRAGWRTLCGDDVCAGTFVPVHLSHQVWIVGSYAVDRFWFQESAKLPSGTRGILYD
ncbi:hypothetical protein D3C74_327690 [compost metagenome]